MKKSIILLTSALSLSTFFVNAQSGWQNANCPLGNDTLIGEIQFINQNHAWICTGKGTALHSSDGGYHWGRVNPFPNDTFFVSSDASMGMSWPDENHGYILASKGNGLFQSKGVELLKTTDGGANWSKQLLFGNNFSALQTQFINESTGWANMFNFNYGVRLLHTTNGGTTWDTLGYNGGAPHTQIVVTFKFVDELHGWAVTTWDDGSDTLGTHWSIEKTNDAGFNWQEVYTGTERNMKELLFINAFSSTQCILEAPGKRFLKTNDGGVNWIAIPFPTFYGTNSKHKNFHFINLNEGWSTEDPNDNSLECLVHHTTDGGLTWEAQHPNIVNGSIFSINFLDADNGLLVGETCTNCNDSNYINDVAVIKRFTGNSTSIKTTSLDRTSLVYPNPNNGSFTILSKYTINKVEVFNLLGELISDYSLKANKVTIDISNKLKGVYLLKVYTNYSTETVRVQSE